jgi:carotenoid cleavage dioxygenase
LLDAARIQDGPVCRIALPHKICSGTHAYWADRARLKQGA